MGNILDAAQLKDEFSGEILVLVENLSLKDHDTSHESVSDSSNKNSNDVIVEDLVTRTTFMCLEPSPNFENYFEGIPSPHNWLDLSENTHSSAS